MSVEYKSIVEHFADHFTIQLAKTTEQLNQIYRLRGDVYCKEFRYEPEERCPGGMERDEYDRHSIHCLVRHRRSGLAAGCVRLIMKPESSFESLLPVEKHCGEPLIEKALAPALFPCERVAEISRLAVHTVFRKRAHERWSTLGISGQSVLFDPDERRLFPMVTTALFMAAVSLTDVTGRHHFYAMMEPRLVRMLKRHGLEFRQVGQIMDFRGPRAAFHLSTEAAIAGIRAKADELFEFVQASLATEFFEGFCDNGKYAPASGAGTWAEQASPTDASAPLPHNNVALGKITETGRVGM